MTFSHARTRSTPRRVAAGVALALAVVGPTNGAAAAADPKAPAGITRESRGEAQPGNAPGQTLYLQQVTIAPGEALTEHFHEGTQVARVVKGVLTYRIIDGAVDVTRRDGSTERIQGPRTIKVRPGESLVETPSLAHAGSNAGRRPVVIDLAALLAEGAPLATPVGQGTPGTPTRFTADLVSQESRLANVGANNAVTYGWNRLTATAADAGGPVAIEMLGNVAYTNGSGPFFGFVTFTFPDGSVLATQMQGAAVKAADTGITSISGTLGVLEGTGRFAGASGTGSLEGTRAAALGQPVATTFDLRVTPPR